MRNETVIVPSCSSVEIRREKKKGTVDATALFVNKSGLPLAS